MAERTLDSGATAPAPLAEERRTTRLGALFSAGGILGAIGTSACCVLPLVLVSLGATGAWLGTLGRLAPYQPYFIAIAVVFLGGGLWLAYRRPKAAACADGTICARPRSRIVLRALLWFGVAVLAVAVGLPYAAPLLGS